MALSTPELLDYLEEDVPTEEQDHSPNEEGHATERADIDRLAAQIDEADEEEELEPEQDYDTFPWPSNSALDNLFQQEFTNFDEAKQRLEDAALLSGFGVVKRRSNNFHKATNQYRRVEFGCWRGVVSPSVHKRGRNSPLQ